MRKDKQSEEVLIEKAVGATIQKLCEKGLFDIYNNADEKKKDYLFNDVNEKLRPNVEVLNDDIVIQ